MDEGTDIACDRPYDWGGWCKHIVAVLLACQREPDLIEVRPTLDELLVGLDGEQLRDFSLRLGADGLLAVDHIERQIALTQATPDVSDANASADLSPQRPT